MAGPVLRSARFRHEREGSWRELEELIGLAERRGPRGLDPDQLFRIPVLYRAALSSLAVAREISLDKNVVAYLSSLATRAYAFVYGSRTRPRTSIAAFFTSRFPELVWAMRLWVAAAALILAAGVAAGFVLTRSDPEHFYSLVSPGMAQSRSPLSTGEELEEILRDPEPHSLDSLGAFASFLFTHNAKIGLSCFVAGVAAGVPVAALVFVNGLTLGALAAIHAEHDLAPAFWAWVLPHGITELLAVCLCAGAGFRLGASIVFPGRRRRLESLAAAGRDAAVVLMGTLLLFLLAAVIEGFFRQLVLDDGLRLAIAAATAAGWTVYFSPLLRSRRLTPRPRTGSDP